MSVVRLCVLWLSEGRIHATTRRRRTLEGTVEETLEFNRA